jgi:hypothetical protein
VAVKNATLIVIPLTLFQSIYCASRPSHSCMPFSCLTDVFEYRLLTKFDRNAPHMIGTAGNEMWATENGVRPVKGRPAALSESRAIGKRFIFIRGMRTRRIVASRRQRPSEGRRSFRLPLLSADHLDMAKLPKTFLSQLHSNTRLLIGWRRHERIPNCMLVDPHCSYL